MRTMDKWERLVLAVMIRAGGKMRLSIIQIPVSRLLDNTPRSVARLAIQMANIRVHQKIVIPVTLQTMRMEVNTAQTALYAIIPITGIRMSIIPDFL